MATRLKHTKNELKAQREALARYERFLPMLQLKKQQLQIEILRLTSLITQNEKLENELRSAFHRWIKLLCDPIDLPSLIALRAVRTKEGNIAGVVIPVLVEVEIQRNKYDLFATPPWVDDALEALERLIRLRVEREILEEERRLIAEELRITSQRVNLFEKVKIPETQENIRIIKVFLGEQQTAAVARSKLAKRHMHAGETNNVFTTQEGS